MSAARPPEGARYRSRQAEDPGERRTAARRRSLPQPPGGGTPVSAARPPEGARYRSRQAEVSQ